jgi:acyl carrier protein
LRRWIRRRRSASRAPAVFDLESVARWLESRFGLKRGVLTASTEFSRDLGFDSLAMLEVALALEDMSGSVIPEEAVWEMKTVGDAYEAVVRGPAAAD